MKVYAVYNKENKFIAAFPDRVIAENYGIDTYGRESGWEYDIIEKYLHEYPTLLSTTPNTPTPYSQPIPLKTTPYIPNIWCECNNPIPIATFDHGNFTP
jgi:hypothetical protein